MTLRLYNTLTRKKERFDPIDPKNVRMYVCGPTVYDYAHICNARPAIVFDVLFRLLRHLYGGEHVTYVRNITDIDDKINVRAKERRGTRNVPVLDVLQELTDETTRIYFEDVAALGNLLPTYTPRATEFVRRSDDKTDMIGLIESLIASGHAYAAEGHVLFDVSSKKDYGKLARRTLDEMVAGARVEVAPYKKNPMDFVLWKPSDAETPGWDSPWGRGRPGWHIECSAMSDAFLGATFDIHGGGIDLLFPHHENELAQSESAHKGKPFAKFWMHNGFLNVQGEKMSKSLGNFVTIRELLEDWPGDVLRLNMLRAQYRQPMDWTLDGLKESHSALERWYASTADVTAARTSNALLNTLLDDLNTPAAIAELHGSSPEERAGGLALLGFSNDSARLALKPPIDASEIEDAISRRNAARKAKDFAESDRIRDELARKGIALHDGPAGTTWDVKR